MFISEIQYKFIYLLTLPASIVHLPDNIPVHCFFQFIVNDY